MCVDLFRPTPEWTFDNLTCFGPLLCIPSRSAETSTWIDPSKGPRPALRPNKPLSIVAAPFFTWLIFASCILKPLETERIVDGWMISGSISTFFLFLCPLLRVTLSDLESFDRHTVLTFERFVAAPRTYLMKTTSSKDSTEASPESQCADQARRPISSRRYRSSRRPSASDTPSLLFQQVRGNTGCKPVLSRRVVSVDTGGMYRN